MLWPDFRLPPPPRGGARLPEAGPPLRRHQAASRQGRGSHVTRLLSGLVHDPAAMLGAIWYAPPAALPARPRRSSSCAACIELTDLMLLAGVRMSARRRRRGRARRGALPWRGPGAQSGFLLVGTMLAAARSWCSPRGQPAPDVPAAAAAVGCSRCSTSAVPLGARGRDSRRVGPRGAPARPAGGLDVRHRAVLRRLDVRAAPPGAGDQPEEDASRAPSAGSSRASPPWWASAWSGFRA